MALADGVVQFGDIRLGVQEGDVGYVNVVRSGSTVGAVSVLLNVGVGGTARFGTDFDIELPLGVVQIADGELSASVKITALERLRCRGHRICHAVPEFSDRRHAGGGQ